MPPRTPIVPRVSTDCLTYNYRSRSARAPSNDDPRGAREDIRPPNGNRFDAAGRGSADTPVICDTRSPAKWKLDAVTWLGATQAFPLLYRATMVFPHARPDILFLPTLANAPLEIGCASVCFIFKRRRAGLYFLYASKSDFGNNNTRWWNSDYQESISFCVRRMGRVRNWEGEFVGTTTVTPAVSPEWELDKSLVVVSFEDWRTL